MKMEEIRPGTVVRNVVSGEIGVLFEGYDYGVIDSSVEVPIIYQSKDKTSTAPSFTGTKFEDLEPYSLKPEDTLTPNHLNNVCMPGTEKACRYLMLGADGFDCAKVYKDSSMAEVLDRRVREGSIRATGNNCEGKYSASK